MKKVNSKMLATLAFLLALEVVLTRFLSINLPIVRIGFGFLPIAVAAILYGPLWAGITYALGDVIGVMIAATGQPFPGFTLTAFLVGLLYGVFLYKKTLSWGRVTICVLVVVLGCSFLLNTLWLAILYGNAFVAMLPTRLLQAAILIPIEIVSIKLLNDRLLRRLLPTD